MNLKALQEQYRKGKITKEEYLAKLKELLDGDEINQEEFDEAKEFDPTDPDTVPRYSQRDFDQQLIPAAVRKLRKVLKAAGVEIDVPNKQLLEKVIELSKLGQGKEPPADSEVMKENAELKKQLDKAGDSAAVKAENDKLRLELAVFKATGKFKPHNPTQVVRALMADYIDLLEENDEGDGYTPKSIEKAIKRISEAEPNLFQAQDGDDEDGDEQKPGFRGKPPGGPGERKKGKDADFDKKKSAMLNLMGLSTGNK